MSMINIIKQAGVGAIHAQNPVHILFGTVTKSNPLEVNVEQKFTLTEDFLILTERLTRYEENEHTHSSANGETTPPSKPLIIRAGLKNGDKVILLRVQGGQQFVVLDKVV